MQLDFAGRGQPGRADVPLLRAVLRICSARHLEQEVVAVADSNRGWPLPPIRRNSLYCAVGATGLVLLTVRRDHGRNCGRRHWNADGRLNLGSIGAGGGGRQRDRGRHGRKRFRFRSDHWRGRRQVKGGRTAWRRGRDRERRRRRIGWLVRSGGARTTPGRLAAMAALAAERTCGPVAPGLAGRPAGAGSPRRPADTTARGGSFSDRLWPAGSLFSGRRPAARHSSAHTASPPIPPEPTHRLRYASISRAFSSLLVR